MGIRSTGGHFKCSKDTIHTALKGYGVSGSWKELSQDRDVWRGIYHNSAATFPSPKNKKPHNIEPLICEICGRTISSRIGMHSHMREHRWRDEIGELADAYGVGTPVSGPDNDDDDCDICIDVLVENLFNYRCTSTQVFLFLFVQNFTIFSCYVLLPLRRFSAFCSIPAVWKAAPAGFLRELRLVYIKHYQWTGIREVGQCFPLKMWIQRSNLPSFMVHYLKYKIFEQVYLRLVILPITFCASIVGYMTSRLFDCLRWLFSDSWHSLKML